MRTITPLQSGVMLQRVMGGDVRRSSSQMSQAHHSCPLACAVRAAWISHMSAGSMTVRAAARVSNRERCAVA
jgi:hypothetical protein